VGLSLSCKDFVEATSMRFWPRTRHFLAPLVFLASVGLAEAGETPKKKPDEPKSEAEKDKPGEEPKAPEPAITPAMLQETVAKVHDAVITRADLVRALRRLALARRRPLPNNKQLLEQLITEALWRRYFDEKALRPAPAQITAAIQRMDAELRRRRSSYQRFLAALGMSVEEHASLLSYDLAMRRLVETMQKEIPEKELKGEFDAHPDWYDGSRIRISQIFIDTRNVGEDPKELEKAKKEIEKIHAELVAGKEFERLARDYSEGAARARGGDRGWFQRKGPEVDEPLIGAAWKLEAGKCSKPIRGAQGWHVLKVTKREPPRFTYFGCKQRILQELTRRRLKTILDELKAKAKIERFI